MILKQKMNKVSRSTIYMEDFKMDISKVDRKQLETDFKKLTNYIDGLVEGDDYFLDEMYKLLQSYGICDEDGFFVYSGDDI